MGAGTVHDALPEVGERLVGVVEPAPLGVHGDEGVLDDLLGGALVVEQQDREPHQLPPVRDVQHLERLVGAPARRHVWHQPDLCMSDHGSGTRAVPPRFTCVAPRHFVRRCAAVEDDCLFCRIVAGEIPADVVAETEDAVAFRDLNPQAPLHVLVVPRQHVADAAELADHAPATVAELVASPAGSPPTPVTTATAWCSTPAPTPVRPCSTPTCTCWPDGRMTWPPGLSLRAALAAGARSPWSQPAATRPARPTPPRTHRRPPPPAAPSGGEAPHPVEAVKPKPLRAGETRMTLRIPESYTPSAPERRRHRRLPLLPARPAPDPRTCSSPARSSSPTTATSSTT